MVSVSIAFCTRAGCVSVSGGRVKGAADQLYAQYHPLLRKRWCDFMKLDPSSSTHKVISVSLEKLESWKVLEIDNHGVSVQDISKALFPVERERGANLEYTHMGGGIVRHARDFRDRHPVVIKQPMVINSI